jgi:hypothetical protein
MLLSMKKSWWPSKSHPLYFLIHNRLRGSPKSWFLDKLYLQALEQCVIGNFLWNALI